MTYAVLTLALAYILTSHRAAYTAARTPTTEVTR